MAFIETTTNSIVIDAVLTKRGRALLASGVSEFQITKFGLADDEMDYTVDSLESLLTTNPQQYPILQPTINGELMLNSQLYTDASITAGNRWVTVIEIPGLSLPPAITTISSGVTVAYYPASTGRTAETYDITITSTDNSVLSTIFTKISGDTGRDGGLSGSSTTLYGVSSFTLKLKSLASATSFGIKVKGNVTSVAQNYSCAVNADPNYANAVS